MELKALKYFTFQGEKIEKKEEFGGEKIREKEI